MNLEVFKGHETPEQAQLVWAHGIFIACRYRLSYTICLFDMGTFFAEVWLHSGTKKMITVRGLPNITFLDPYLDSISLISLGLDNSLWGRNSSY